MFAGYLTVRRSCVSCGEALHHHRADDLPAYVAIMLVGKIIIGLLVTVELAWSPPLWVHWVTWPALTLALALWLLPRTKGAVVGLQWAWRMHGFASDD